MVDIMHYGVKGMHWGVRRYQNSDGTLTPEGKKHLMYRNRTIRAGKTKNDVDSIIKTMSSDDKEKLAIHKGEGYLTYEQGSAVVKRILEKQGNKPISFFDLLDDGDNINVALGTRAGKKYRGKGYANSAVSKGMDWVDKNKDLIGNKNIVWGVRTDNKGSIRLAEKHGFKLDPNSYSDDKKWVNYVKKLKKED